MTRTKKFLCLFLTLIFIISLAACGGPKKPKGIYMYEGEPLFGGETYQEYIAFDGKDKVYILDDEDTSIILCEGTFTVGDGGNIYIVGEEVDDYMSGATLTYDSTANVVKADLFLFDQVFSYVGKWK